MDVSQRISKTKGQQDKKTKSKKSKGTKGQKNSDHINILRRDGGQVGSFVVVVPQGL